MLCYGLRIGRRFHRSLFTKSYLFKEVSRSNVFENSDDSASIQERALFNKVLENMEKKQELKQNNMNNSLMNGNNTELKVSFGKYDEEAIKTSSTLNTKNQFAKGTKNENYLDKKLRDITENNDNKPLFKILDDVEYELKQNQKKTLEESDLLGPDYIRKYTPKVNNLRINMTKLEAEERYKVELKKALEPYIKILKSEIHTDFEMMEKVQELLRTYISRDKSTDIDMQSSPADIIKQINANCESSLTTLPQPYGITLPFIIVHLLTSSEFEIPIEKKYNIATLVYQECKRCSDISLYLNVCNVDFYNMLIHLYWGNFYEVHGVKQFVQEMQLNGIIGDIYTVELLDNIVSEMRTMNDDIIDEENIKKIKEKALNIGVVWSKEADIDLIVIETYLKKLKEALTVGQEP